MSYKHVTRYRVAYFNTGSKAGCSDIVIVFEDGSQYVFESLPSDTAHHLVDLLRNEKPIWMEPETGTLVVADEPVGSGE